MDTLRDVAIMILVLTIFCFVLDETKRVTLPDTTYGYSIVDVDEEENLLYIELSEQLVSGSDGSCQVAGQIINDILEQNPEWKIYVTNEWVPSKHNPIDLAWSRVLAEGY
jgi:hypothetical protein